MRAALLSEANSRSRINNGQTNPLPQYQGFPAAVALRGHNMDSTHSEISLQMSIDKKNPAEDVFIAPLSSAQQRLWFLYQLEPESAAYNIQAEVRIEGKLDHAALERSLNEVVRRHESFRTSFLVSDEQVWQVITPELTFHVEHVDLRHLSSAERESEAQRLVRQATRKPFDLEQSPSCAAACYGWKMNRTSSCW